MTVIKGSLSGGWMVKKLVSKNAYKCEECNLLYSERKWAERCEKWCAKHSTCNLQIIRHAVM